VPESHFDLDWDAYAKEIGLRLQAVREAQHVSQIELANSTGVSRNQIQNIELNRTFGEGPGNTTLKTVFALAQGLGVPVRLLLPEDAGAPVAAYDVDLVWPRIKPALVAEAAAYEVPRQTKQSSRVGHTRRGRAQ
jgi:transcriptional regulator with XRE-family HTH domain